MNTNTGTLLFWAAVFIVAAAFLLALAAVGGIRKTFGPFWQEKAKRKRDE